MNKENLIILNQLYADILELEQALDRLQLKNRANQIVIITVKDKVFFSSTRHIKIPNYSIEIIKEELIKLLEKKKLEFLNIKNEN